MIRRILSLLLGGVLCWALYALIARLALEKTPAGLMLGSSSGMEGFMLAAAPALAACLVVSLLLARLPLVKRAWMTAGAVVIAGALCLFALVLMGAGV